MPIGIFQLDNLIQNRVPFSLYAWNVDLSQRYKGIQNQHLNQVFRQGEQLAAEISDLKKNLAAPVVLVCTDGKHSKMECKKLESEGFLNVCYLQDGWSSIQ